MRLHRAACLLLVLLGAFAVGCVRLAPPVSTVIFPSDFGDTLTLALPGHIPQETVAKPIPGIDELILAEMEKQRIVGLGLGVIRGGRTIYLKGYGWEDRELRVPVRSRRTRFRWASLSKMLTSVSAFQVACMDGPVLVEPNRSARPCLDLDADIRTYLSTSTPYDLPRTYLAKDSSFGFAIGPACPTFTQLPLNPTQRSITLGQLLSHRAGIQHYASAKLDGCPIPTQSPVPPDRGIDFTDALSYLSGNPFVVKPGTRFYYTTFGFSLAGQVIEDFGGKQFEDQVEERISRPLNLSTLRPDEPGLGNRAVGYKVVVETPSSSDETDLGTLIAAPEIRIVRDGDQEIRYKLPGGGFSSTVADLNRFCKGLIDGSLLSEARRKAMWSIPEGATDNAGARFGFFVGARNGHRRVGHTGVQQKASCRLQLYPDEDLCVVVMTNTIGTGIDMGAITNGVEDVVRSLPITDITLGGIEQPQPWSRASEE